MFCSFCGQQLEDGSKFCPYCGGPVSAPQENTAIPNTPPVNKKPVNKALLAGAIISGVAVIGAAVFGVYTLTHKDPADKPVTAAESQTKEVSGIDKIITAYQKQVTDNNGHNVALIDFDGDDTPELIYTSQSAYKMFTYKDDAVVEISVTPGNSSAKLSGNKFYNGQSEAADNRFEQFFFEYVPGKKQIRTHSADSNKNDFYITYDDSLNPTLLLQSTWSGKWTTYVNGTEVDNEDFNKQRVENGFDKLVKCEYYYSDVQSAYDNMSKTPSKSQLFADFLAGKLDAVDSVTSINADTDEFSFSTSSYSNYRSNIDESDWTNSDYEYKDFDNDGIDELIVYGSSCNALFFETFGDNVYLLFSSGGTADMASVENPGSGNVIVRSDIGHMGRQYHYVSTYDACGCLVDWYELNAEYFDNSTDRYDSNSDFSYRGNKISMAEYEKLYNALYGIVKTDEEIRNKEIITAYETYINGLDEYAALNKFEFIYLDDDDIPELVGTVNGENFLLLTYKDGKITKTPGELFPSYSTFYYKPKSGSFMYSLWVSPEMQSYAYTYKDGKLTKKSEWLSTKGETGEGYGYLGDDDYYYDDYEEGYVYYINGEQVSEEAFNENASKYEDYTSVPGEYDNIWAAADALGLKY